MRKKILPNKCLSWIMLLTLMAGTLLLPQTRAVYAADANASEEETAGESAESGEVPTDVQPGETASDDSGTDSGIDDGSVTVRQQTVWYWHKGLPPQDGKEYRVLMCWDDRYYMTIDSSFLHWMSLAATSSYYAINSSYSATGLTNSSWADAGNGCPDGRYQVEVGYRAVEGKLSELDFDYNVLKTTGSAVSFKLPELPVMKRLSKVPAQGLWEETNQDRMADRVLIGITPSQEDIDDSGNIIFKSDETNWLAGFRFMDYRVEEDSFLGVSYDSTQKRIFRWYLYPVNSLIYNRYSEFMEGSFRNMTRGSSVTDFINKNLDVIAWHVSEQDGEYVFTEDGFRTSQGRVSHSFSNATALQQLIDHAANIELGHSGGTFASYGNRHLYRHSSADVWHSVDYDTRGKFGFDVYYAEPNLMYFLKSDIVVENGQTQNLDGPLVIEEGVKITVKNGGVLSLTDWIVNSGEIMIESGGTMLLQQNAIGSVFTRNCAMISNNKDSTAGGRVSCDGNIIVMPNCSLAAAGLYGLQLGEGAQVANYGQIVAENWDVYTEYAVEGRDSNSCVYLGYTMSDTGFELVPEGFHRIRDLNCLSTYHGGSFRGPGNWLYGKSTYSVVKTGMQSIVLPNRKGHVVP